MTQFPVVDDCLIVGGMRADAPRRSASGRRRSTPTTARLLDARVARAARAPAARGPAALRDEGQSDAGARRAHGGPRRRLDVASGGELRVALDAGMRSARDQLRRARARATPSSRRRSPPASSSTSNRRASSSCSRGCRASCGVPARVAVRVNPGLRAEVVGHEDGRRPEAVRRRCRGGAARCSREIGRARPRVRRLPHLQRLAEPAAPKRSARRSKSPSSSRCGWPQHAPAPVQRAEHRRRLRHSVFSRASSRSTSRRSATTCASSSTRAARRCRRRALVIELGRYLVGEAGIYVCRVVDRKVSRGQVFLVTDGGLHHHLAASGNFGQVHPQELSGRRSATGCAARGARSLRSSGRCARRSICWPTGWTSPKRSRATWSSSSSPAPTARPRARAHS